MNRIEWRQLNYLRLVLIAGWVEFQFFLGYLVVAKGATLLTAARIFTWQLIFLVFIIQATKKGPSYKSNFHNPPSKAGYYVTRTFSIILLTALLVTLMYMSFITINRLLPFASSKIIVTAHLTGQIMAVALAWATSEYVQYLLFRLITKAK